MISLWMFGSMVDAAPDPTGQDATDRSDKLQVSEFVTLARNLKSPNQIGLDQYQLVVDLRFTYEGAYEERAATRDKKIQYINIPMSSRLSDTRSVERLENAIASHAGLQILIHDSNGQRAALIWAAHLIHEGVPMAEAVARVEGFVDSEVLAPRLSWYANVIALSRAGAPDGTDAPQPDAKGEL